jgi:hypothetical protein
MKALKTVTLIFGLSLIFFAAATSASAADRVILVSGSVIDGSIILETETVIVVELSGVGTVRIRREEIAEIRRDLAHVPGTRVNRTRTDEAEAENSTLIRYEDLKPGTQVMLILTGEEHEQWRGTGQRYYCRVDVAGERRMKVLTDPSAGTLGHLWIPRDAVGRIIDVAKVPDYQILFFEGAQTGSWVHIATRDGALVAGMLEGVTNEGQVRLTVPAEESLEQKIVPIDEILSLQAVVKKSGLIEKLGTLESGEPVVLNIWGRSESVTGMFVGTEGENYVVETAEGMVKLYKGLPIVGVECLSSDLRKKFLGLERGVFTTVQTMTDEEQGTLRRSLTGKLTELTLTNLTLDTVGGKQTIDLTQVVSVAKPEEQDLPALTGTLTVEATRQPLNVLPGMKQADAESRLPTTHVGLDVLYSGGVVEKVYCRAPWSGSPFGLQIGGSLSDSLKDSELVFDTQLDAKDQTFTTMLSHSLKGILVTLYVTRDGKILGLEVTSR